MNSYVENKKIVDEKIKLERLDLELTHRCNNKCIHCAVNLDENDNQSCQEVGIEFYQDILTQARVLQCKRILITGGEPLLHPNFSEIYIFAAKMGFSITVFTNATLIDPTYIKLFSEFPPECIEITVYGMTRESYEKVSRVKDSWQNAFRGIHLLHGKQIPIRLKGIRFPFNIDDNKKLKKWAKELNLEQETSFVYGLTMRTINNDANSQLKIQSLRLDPENYFQFLNETPKVMQKEFLRTIQTIETGHTKIFRCSAGYRNAAVDPYGNLLMCLTLRHKDTVYDLKTGSLADALLNVFPKIRAQSSNNKNYLQRCSNCLLRTICSQCPSSSWAESGIFDEPVEFFCRLAHAQARFAGLLKDGEFGWELEKHAMIKARFVKEMKMKNVENA